MICFRCVECDAEWFGQDAGADADEHTFVTGHETWSDSLDDLFNEVLSRVVYRGIGRKARTEEQVWRYVE